MKREKTIDIADVSAYVTALEKAAVVIKSVPLLQKKLKLKNEMLAAILTGAHKKKLSQENIKQIMQEVEIRDRLNK